MYWRRFNLTGEPFSLTPDPAFLYLSSVHAEAFAALTMGLKERRGLISMIGEVGTGKTTLVYSLLNNLGPEIHTAYISNARLSFDGILRSALRDFGIECDDKRGVELLETFNDFLHRCAQEGTTAALVIDEAQNLSYDTFEDLRLLSNFETYKHKLLQIVLVGQPELDTKLRDPALRQVAERIAVRTHVNPLTPQETRHYIEHRLAAVGGNVDIFSEPALRTVVSRSAGIPRAINILCHNAMLFAYGQAKDKVSRSMVLEAVNEKEGSGLVRIGSAGGGAASGPLSAIRLDTPAWTWNAALLILAVGLSIAMIRVAGNISVDRSAPAEQPQPAAVAAPASAPAIEPAPEGNAPAPADPAAVAAAKPASVAPVAAKPAPKAPALPPDPPKPATPVDTSKAAKAPAAIVAKPVPAAKPAPAKPAKPASAEAAAKPAPAPTPAAPAPAKPEPKPVVSEAPVAAPLAPPAPIPPAAPSAPAPERVAALDTGGASALPPVNADDDDYRIVPVEPGNSLSDLMIAVYGEYSNSLVRRVQELNPQITDPDRILAGDSLRFPSDQPGFRFPGEEDSP